MRNEKSVKQKSQEKRINYSFKVEDAIYRRIEKIVHILTFLDQNQNAPTKQKWLLEAINEKIENETELPQEAISDKQLIVRIDENLNEKLDKKIAKIKKLRPNYSKKKWILEAICEKLEQEEAFAKDRLITTYREKE